CSGARMPTGCTGISPAINAGDNAICADPPVNGVDQRGVSRLGDAGCDIGAVEAPPTCVPTTCAKAKTCGTLADGCGGFVACGCPLPSRRGGLPGWRISVTLPDTSGKGRARATAGAYVTGNDAGETLIPKSLSRRKRRASAVCSSIAPVG